MFRDPRRTTHGTIHQQSPDDKENLLRFQLADDALNRTAPERVITCLRRYAEHGSLDDSLFQDWIDANDSMKPAADREKAAGSFVG